MDSFLKNRYHNGWLTLQRRQIRNLIRREGGAGAQQDRPGPVPGNENPNNENNENQANVTEQNLANPSIFRLITTFILTFFTSLIPERPRAAVN